MEISIGIRGINHEIKVEVSLSEGEVKDLFRQSMEEDKPLELTDAKGHTIMVPASALGYLQIGKTEPRRVGFGID